MLTNINNIISVEEKKW